MYVDRNLKQKIRDKLSLLKQTKSVASYSAEFQQIIISLNLKNDDNSKLSMFYTNLDQTIKNQLIYFPSAKIFTQLLDQCIAIDQRNYTHRKAKQSAKKSFKLQQSDAPKRNNNDDSNFKKSNHSNPSSKPTNYNRPFNSSSSN